MPFACRTMASSEDGVCLFGVAGPGTGFLSLRRERREALPFWSCLCGFSLPSTCLRRDLPAWHPLAFCLPCVGSQGATSVSLSSWVPYPGRRLILEAWEDGHLGRFQAPVTLIRTRKSGVFLIPVEGTPNAVLAYLYFMKCAWGIVRMIITPSGSTR